MAAPETLNSEDLVPRLSRAERDRRWGLLRAQMVLHNVDALLVWGNDRSTGCATANLRYLTSVAGFGGVAVFPLEGAPRVFAGSTHSSFPISPYLLIQDWVEDVRPIGGMRPVVETLREMGLERGRIGLVGYGLAGRDIITYQEYLALVQALPAATFFDATSLFNVVRMKKSEEEVAMLRRAAVVARAMLDTMTAAAEPGVRECELFARMVHEQIRLGGGPFVFLILSSGPVGGERPLIHGWGPPFSPTARVLGRDDLIITEYHGSYAGYLVGVEASLFIGTPPAPLKALYDVAGEAMAAGVQQFRPGVPLRAVWEAIRRPVREAGYDFVELGFHGHGLGSPEFPSVVHSTGKGNMTGRGIGDLPLEAGMVFGLNIDIFDPQWRTDTGVMFGDTVLVTADGPELLVGVKADLGGSR